MVTGPVVVEPGARLVTTGMDAMMEADVAATSDTQMVSSSSPQGKPLDARLLDRPSSFDGDVRRWPSLRLKFEAWLIMVDGELGH